MNGRHYYSVSTARYEHVDPDANLIAAATVWLLDRQREDGLWGSADGLDQFISTTHAVMALLAIGFSPDDAMLSNALGYLEHLDPETHLSFYWRSGVFLNLTPYRALALHDAQHIWDNLGRIAVHRDYPLLFFLFKLVRFGELEGDLPFSAEEVLAKILDDWKPDRGWYGRTSISSMALGLIYDLEFPNKAEVLGRTEEFLLSRLAAAPEVEGLDKNLVDDAFTAFNLAERGFVGGVAGASLAPIIDHVAARMRSSVIDGDHWTSPPPFGGSIGPDIYPTAVVIRALMSLHATQAAFPAQVASRLIARRSGALRALGTPATAFRSFWGPLQLDQVDSRLCFMLMPFSPPSLTEIYNEFIKEPLEQAFDVVCLRADDIMQSSSIINDIWEHINRAQLIIADVTNMNANVFYELGMSHVLGKNVILISQSLEFVPFDLRAIRIITYQNSPRGYKDLARQITQYSGQYLRARP